jgi:hypothetical protein
MRERGGFGVPGARERERVRLRSGNVETVLQSVWKKIKADPRTSNEGEGGEDPSRVRECVRMQQMERGFGVLF